MAPMKASVANISLVGAPGKSLPFKLSALISRNRLISSTTLRSRLTHSRNMTTPLDSQEFLMRSPKPAAPLLLNVLATSASFLPVLRSRSLQQKKRLKNLSWLCRQRSLTLLLSILRLLSVPTISGSSCWKRLTEVLNHRVRSTVALWLPAKWP